MLHRSYDRTGFSLLETLISASLMLLVFGLGARFLIPLLRMQATGAERVELQQRAAILMDQLRGDLQTTTTAGISLVQSSTEMILAIHSADNVAQDGTLVWQDRLIVHHWKGGGGSEDRVWTRAIWTDQSRRLLKATRATRLSESTLRQVLAQAVVVRRSEGVMAAKVDYPGAANSEAGLPLSIDLVLATAQGETRSIHRTLGGRLPAL